MPGAGTVDKVEVRIEEEELDRVAKQATKRRPRPAGTAITIRWGGGSIAGANVSRGWSREEGHKRKLVLICSDEQRLVLLYARKAVDLYTIRQATRPKAVLIPDAERSLASLARVRVTVIILLWPHGSVIDST